jgi:ATP-dependent Lon protease
MQNIKQGIEGHAVDWYSDVFDIVFPDVDAEHINNLWKEQLKEPADKKSTRDKERDVLEEADSNGNGDN